VKPGNGIVKWLKRNGWPTGFRIACHNCNSAYGFFGYCPHQAKESSFDEVLKEMREEEAESKRIASGSKTCSVCKVIKPLGDFCKNSRSPTGYRGVCRPCEKTANGTNRAAGHLGWGPEHHKKANVKANRKLKLEVVRRYGGKCACCGESRPEFLSVDHEAGGGNRHRKEVPEAVSLSKWLKRQGWPSGLRVLCMNCNLAIGSYESCPHKKGP